MSGARDDSRLTPPTSPPGSVLEELAANATSRRAPAAAAAPAPAPAPAPADAPAPAPAPAAEQAPVAAPARPVARKRAAPVPPRRRGTTPEVPMPDRVAGSAGTPLQVRIAPGKHWQLKSQTFLRGTNMTRIVSALVTIYLDDPELCEALIEDAERHDITLGELLHDAHVDVAAGSGGGGAP